MNIRIGIIKDINIGWWKRFEVEIQPYGLEYVLIEIEKEGWIKEVMECSHLIWVPNLSDPYLRQGREKLYFIENILGKPVYPSSASFWHYDNKNAQHYMAQHFGLKMPETFISYSYEDALDYLQHCRYPLVSKSAAGSASSNVRLLRTKREAERELRYLFNRSIPVRAKHKFLLLLGLVQNKYSFQKHYVHYQEFIPDNPGDFRVTTIGNRYTFAFVRLNREKDFRASGSGRIVYDCEQHHEDAIRYCLNVSRKLGFDTMCYDILFRDGDFLLTEFSYTYSDIAIYNAPGYYVEENGRLIFREGNVWPQELLLRYLLTEKWGIHDGIG